MVAAALAPACVAGRAGGAPLPPSPGQFDVAMSEYRFDHAPEAAAGRLVFRVTNAGAQPHALVLVELDEDVPPLDEQLRSDTRRAVPTVVQIPERPPGSFNVFAADLAPGRYGFICFVKDADGVAHYLRGMSSEFRVR
jgi:hypothetical protein